MGCGTASIKYTLFTFNTLWAIIGILVILFGGFGWNAMPDSYALSFIILGCGILLISFFGCVGAIRESRRMLWTYTTFLFIVLVVVVAFMFFGTRDVFKKYAMNGVEVAWKEELQVPGAMDVLQKTYECCGRDGATDYINIGRGLPSSCCKENNCINPLNIYASGCMDKVEKAFADELTTTRYYEWGLLVLDFILLVLALILAIHYTNRNRRYNY